ncbi:SGNH/GDSL hydrolase family protein [Owenweeksia hongkongensis]|uniref:SGNH/GDSL hydrolase family protein n=1 Tax=Owenweeksia hongkongensis TaxID=253245 RepID=UPI003A9343F0
MNFLRHLCLSLIIILSACDKKNKHSIAEHESYRFYLWQLLNANNWDFDFIGTHHDNYFYPGFRGVLFDRDHEGISGIQTVGVLNHMDFVLDHIPKPDVVLLGIGGNDLASGSRGVEETVDNIKEIINRFQAVNPNVVILVEQIAPIKESEESIALVDKLIEFNNLIAQLPISESTSRSKVISVDMFSNWSNQNFADDVHYNTRGAQEVAFRYYIEIVKHLNFENHYRILPIGDSRVEGYKSTSEHVGFRQD